MKYLYGLIVGLVLLLAWCARHEYKRDTLDRIRKAGL